jgi:MFS superfamily sulfate permease-like transporter
VPEPPIVGATPSDPAAAPRGDADGFRRWIREDMTAGFLVFLIALPLCLGISVASGFPPVAGVFTAIVGACLTPFISNSELTIKGPAAGLIVIVLGAMQAFGFTGGQDPAKDLEAYRLTLAVGCAAGIVQVIFGLLRTGVVGEFFPTAVVHGMLAAIGVIIILKQFPVMLGEKAATEPFEILRELPETLLGLNPAIALVGITSLAILVAMPLLRNRLPECWLKRVPAQLIVLIVAVPMALGLGLGHEHSYVFGEREYPLGPQFLINVPARLSTAVTFPDFSAFTDPARLWTSLKWLVMFALVGNLESILSAKAIDMVDPWKRKTTLDRDLVAVGAANVVAASIGGLPMISEIVRSKANIDNGARTRFADFWHGIFLLAFVALVPWLVRAIPFAALAAMLVYTGFRLASPAEFINVWRIGREQMVIFLGTIIGVLATDLLLGVAIGVATKFVIHAIHGLPLRTMFKPFLEIRVIDDTTIQIDAVGSAVFSNWIPFRGQIEKLGLLDGNNIIVNLEGTRLVDHSVLEKLHGLENDFERAGLWIRVIGLEGHRPLSRHPFATRKRAV